MWTSHLACPTDPNSPIILANERGQTLARVYPYGSPDERRALGKLLGSAPALLVALSALVAGLDLPDTYPGNPAVQYAAETLAEADPPRDVRALADALALA